MIVMIIKGFNFYVKVGSVVEEVFLLIRIVVVFGGEKKEIER